MPQRLYPLALTLSLLGIAPNLSWADSQMEFFRSSERTANASFSAPVAGDTTGCFMTYVTVRVFDDHRFMRKMGPGKPITGSFPSSGASIVIADSCTQFNDQYYECSNIDPAGQDVAASLAGATANTAMTCLDQVDYEAPPFEIRVDIVWDATGPVVRRFVNEHVTGTDEKTHRLVQVASRQAVASGTVWLGGENLIPNESDTAVIGAPRETTRRLEK